MKTCCKCKAEKPKEEFNKHSSKHDGLQSNCKACHSVQKAEYNAANRESIAARKSELYLANRDRIAARSAEHYAANRERIAVKNAEYRQANRERIAAYHAEYYLANPEKFAANCRNRRARLRNAPGSHTAADVRSIFENQRGLCANCHAKLFKSGKNKFHADHIIPLAKGGSNWPDNIQCLCPTCNLSKNAKDPIAWAQQNGRLI